MGLCIIGMGLSLFGSMILMIIKFAENKEWLLAGAYSLMIVMVILIICAMITGEL